MIANVSPSSSTFEDTYNTLKYAARTMCIKSAVKIRFLMFKNKLCLHILFSFIIGLLQITKNVMNESLSIPQYRKMVLELNEKISKIKVFTMSGSIQIILELLFC